MHPSIFFRKPDKKYNIEFARQRGFGTLVVNSVPVPLISHIPFLFSEDGTILEFHLNLSNPIVKMLNGETEAVMVVSGGDAYISPDWYDVENQVPTWNYVAVHVSGVLKKLPSGELHNTLSRLSAEMENRLLPKTPWEIDKMDERVYEKLKRQIVPISMQISAIEGTWKLNQNKNESSRKGAAKGVRELQIGSDVNRIADLMEDLPGE
ncbi:Negative transcriptional regulator [hydrothermal vent metagenome]|uniref:Negative transcriptional regulator n=1 Tax=hydrothermal vent metagenome TaxID=652676 RepID=A0A3B0TTH6_9ZZZZ